MLKKLRMRIKGQSTAEYAILVALVVAAIIAMQTYAKRALQGRIRDASVYMSNKIITDGGGGFGHDTAQYEPYYLKSEFETTRNSDSTMTYGKDGVAGQSGTTDITRLNAGFQKYTYCALENQLVQ